MKKETPKYWRDDRGRWHVDFREKNLQYTTGGGMGFATKGEAQEWLHRMAADMGTKLPKGA